MYCFGSNIKLPPVIIISVVVLLGFVNPIADLKFPHVIFITGGDAVVASSPSRIL